MNYQTVYSPNILIYLKVENKEIRLADVLCETARLYSKDFEDILPGTPADLVFSIDNKESKKSIILSEGLNKNMNLFSFAEVRS
jgi:hypothetical protein